ncbi:MAG: hypothetical protein KDD47_21230, partial [Acidobacteria bacterium]|nr:hypothetical protein [Acidobacteriota bacterium]
AVLLLRRRQLEAARSRSPLTWLLLLAVLLAQSSCIPVWNFCANYEDAPRFNPRLRLDRAPWTDAQKATDPGYGPYRDGKSGGRIDGSELVSDLAPALGGIEEKLPQSDCLWLAAGETPDSPVDFLAGAWEMVADFADDAPLFDVVHGTTRLGECRPRDPVTGQHWVICGPSAEDGNPYPEGGGCEEADISMEIDGGEFGFPAFAGRRDECLTWDFLEEDVDLHDFGLPNHGFPEHAARLQAITPTDGSGECPSRVTPPPPPANDWLLQGDLVERRVGRFGGEVRDLGWRTGCVRRELIPAGGDASYRLYIPDSAASQLGEVVEWLGPNVLTVPGRRTIRRAMARIGSSAAYGWQTEVSRSGGEGGGAVRWQENWSPHAVVEAVRVYKEGPGGRRSAASQQPLRILGDYGPPEGASWECEERTEEGDATFFPIHLEDGSPDCNVRLENVEGTTPTYALEFLDFSAGPLEVPLRWEVETEDVDPETETVYLEFELRAVRDGAFLMADSARDVGDLPVGSSGSGLVTVENVGANAVQVNGISLTGAQAGEWSFEALGDAVFLPLPFEAVPTGSPGAFRLAEVPG